MRAILLCFVLAGACAAQVPDYTLIYGESAANTLDLYCGTAGEPLIVYVHGGGWESGDKYPVRGLGLMLARGFNVASINYRLTDEAIWPAQMLDVRDAVAFLRSRSSEYGFGPRVYGWGPSAGGHLVACTTLCSFGFDAAVDFYGPANFWTLGKFASADSPVSRLLGVGLGSVIRNQDDPDWAWAVNQANSACPALMVAPVAPFYIAHGLDDNVIPYQQSLDFAAALGAANCSVTLRLVPDARHSLPPEEYSAALDWLEALYFGD